MARPARLIPALIATAGALALVLQWQWGRMLWLDEEMIAINLRDRSLVQLAGRLSLGQAAPYGWLAIQRAIFLVLGPDERALRLLPLLFGVGLLITSVWVGRRWMNVAGATTLSVLCAAGQWVSFYALELKHYSADTCFGLLLPALAAWAIEEERALTWWIVAAIAQWFSNGALFVAPACALAILAIGATTRGLRDGVGPRVLRAALPGVLWLGAFGVNYVVTLGPARSSEFLAQYWATAFPPAGAGLLQTVQWVGAQLSPLALKPGGSGLGVWFWIIAGAGFVLGRSGRPPRLVFAAVLLSGLFWSAIRLVPMYERLSLWMIPAAYVGIAFAADAAFAVIVDARVRPRPAAIAAAATLAALLLLMKDVALRGSTYLMLQKPEANHEVDDRSAVRWLSRQRQAGDVWVTTHNALAAIWWYANDRGPVLEAIVESERSACGQSELGEALRRAGASRALVYLGFGHEVPPAFDDTLVARLGSLGRINAYDRFGESSHALIVDLREPPTGPATLASLGATGERPTSRIAGCIAATPARSW